MSKTIALNSHERILKYAAVERVDDGQSYDIELPWAATILSLGVQHGVPTVWAGVPAAYGDLRTKRYELVATGSRVPAGAEYHGTVIVDDGNEVWHLFSLCNPQNKSKTIGDITCPS
jgi:hypothetical protein